MSAFDVRVHDVTHPVNTMDDIQKLVEQAVLEYSATYRTETGRALYHAYGEWNHRLHPGTYITWQDGAQAVRKTLDEMLPEDLRRHAELFWGLVEPMTLLPDEPLEDTGDPLQEAMKETL